MKRFGLQAALTLLAVTVYGCLTPVRHPAPPPVSVAFATASCRDIWAQELFRAIDEEGLTDCVRQFQAGATDALVRANVRRSPEWIEKHAPKPPKPITSHPIAGRIRVRNGRFVNDAGDVPWFEISEFDLVHLARTGRLADVQARLDRDTQTSQGQLRIVRVFAQASILFDLRQEQPGYYDAVDAVLRESSQRGLYVELVAFCDAQILQPNASARDAVLRNLLDRFGRRPEVIVSLANEPQFNGWKGATDPGLLHLADIAAVSLGHRDFIVGDPTDGDTADASAETILQAKTLARVSNILAIHSSRKGNAYPDGTNRMRRWVDHLESASDVLKAARSASGHDVALAHNEPMGAASVFRVPIAGRNPYEREADPEAMLAGGLTGLYTVGSFDYHRIATQDAGTPGLDLLGAVLSQVRITNACTYLNDSWAGSPSHGFSPAAGKVRWMVCGSKAYGVGYWLNTQGTISMANGWHITKTIYRSPDHESGRQAETKVQVLEAGK